MALAEDLWWEALKEREAEAEEFEHEGHYGHEAEWADDCRLCRENVEEADE